MKTFTTKAVFATAFTGLGLFGCTKETEVVEPNTAPLTYEQENKLVGYDPTTCNLIQSFGAEVFPLAVNKIEEDGAAFLVKAQKRGSNGKYLAETQAVLLDPFTPASDLVNMMEAHMLGIEGLLTVADNSGAAANQAGGRLIFDFSPVGSVTMKTILVADIDEEDAGSKVELFSSTGQLLDKQELIITEDKGAGFISFDNVPGVAKMVVTFGDERKNIGSGAVARIQMCAEGQGRYDEVCYAPVQSAWLQYTGDKLANIEVIAKSVNSSKMLFSAKGVKPGTMFKVADSGGLRDELVIRTQRKEEQHIPTACSAPTSIQKQYGSFTIVEARSTDYPILLQ
ncbi:hypothetical protein [Pontibacter sp. SGAir0037]|uniref:hypothetical protein n=1 Tax=Pontibacter sp. SGAir0037 TaxID=2571030 RepID=UPI0010CD2F74|nr:hypothetical protein [Pontibacter sp. SGAir0037]QCR23974.1 hypothetical protein C1N53_17535 [Pontibacter sp. SGAir0037]